MTVQKNLTAASLHPRMSPLAIYFRIASRITRQGKEKDNGHEHEEVGDGLIARGRDVSADRPLPDAGWGRSTGSDRNPLRPSVRHRQIAAARRHGDDHEPAI